MNDTPRMTLVEAMKEAWKDSMKWMTKRNGLQSVALVTCGATILAPWFPIGWVYITWNVPNGVLPFGSFLFCCGLAVLWSVYWMKVLNRWWPF